MFGLVDGEDHSAHCTLHPDGDVRISALYSAYAQIVCTDSPCAQSSYTV